MRSRHQSARRNRIGGDFRRDVSRQRFAILAFLVAIAAFTGGSYRSTMPSLLILRPCLVMGIGAMVLLPGSWDWRGLKTLAGLLSAFVLTMLIQLIDLPAAWWAAMPGHARYAEIVALAPAVARPISLVPDLTINGILALLPAVAVLVAFAGMNDRDRWNTLWIVLGLCGVSALMGLFQAAGGNGPAALGGVADEGVVTGLLANRNHGAVLLAVALPIVATLLRVHVRKPATRWSILGGVAMVTMCLILVGGSRTGMILGIVSLGIATGLLFERGQIGGRHRLVIAGGGVAALLGILALAILSGRALSVARLGALLDPGDEVRFRSFSILVRMTRDFWPFGIGYGAFDPVYRGYEPDAFLHSSYFNRAHNDLIETIMSGGLPALVVLAAFLFWLGRRGVAVIRASRKADPAGLPKAAVGMAAILLLASLVDYPLRTAIMAIVFTFCCCWLATGTRPRQSNPTAPGFGRRAARENGR